MAGYDDVVRGINIPIGADLTPFGEAIESADIMINGLSRSVKELEKQLKIEWNEDKANEAQKKIRDAIELTSMTAKSVQSAMQKVVNPDTKEGQKQIAALQKKYDELQITLAKLNKESEVVTHLRADSLKKSFDEANKAIQKTQSTMAAIRAELSKSWDDGKFRQLQELNAHAIDESRKKAELLNARLSELQKLDTDRARAEIETVKKEIISTENETARLKRSFEELGNLKFENIKKQFDDVQKRLDKFSNTIMPASAALSAGFAFASKAAIDMDSAMVGVAKTTDLTAGELATMKEEIISLSTEIPVAATELAGIAENAGQLGIAKENILGFTRVMADLGATTNFTGEEAAQTSAKFANITQMSQKDFNRLGSSIADLGNNSATTEKDIASMAMRLAAAGTQADMTQAEIVGMAAAMSSLGLEAEAGGTAFSKTINAINLAVQTGSDKLAEFASVAGMSAEQFAGAWRKDAAGAFVGFIEGLNTASGGVIVTLDELGMTAARQGDALTRAAGSGDVFRQSIERSNKAWADNTALAKEAETRYSSAASELTILKNEVNALGIQLGDRILPQLINLARAGGDVVEWLSDMDEATGGAVTQLGLFVAALGPATKLTSGLIGLIGPLVAKLIAQKAATDSATASQVALNTAMAANPYGAIAAAIGIVVSAIGALIATNVLMSEETDKNVQKTKELIDSLEQSKGAFQERADGIESNAAAAEFLLSKLDELIEKEGRTEEENRRLLAIVDQLNSAVPDLNLAYDEQAQKLNMTSAAIADVIAQKRELLMVQAMEQQAADIASKIADAEVQIEKNRRARLETENQLLLARQELEDAEKEAIANLSAYGESYGTYYDQVVGGVKKTVDAYQKKLNELGESDEALIALVEELTTEFDISMEAASELANSIAVVGEEMQDTGESVQDLTNYYETLSSTTSDLISETDAFTAALDEQHEKGELSAQTILKLIDAGYAAALAIDTETGAVTLNAAAFESLYLAKLKEQQISLMQQRSAIMERMEGERAAAIRLTEAFGNATVAKAAYLALDASEEELARINALDAALTGVQKRVSDYTPQIKSSGGAKSSGGTKSPSSEKQKTQEEINLEAYKEALKIFKREQELSDADDVVKKKAYYDKLSELQSQYLAKESDEWWDTEIERKKLRQDLQDNAHKTHQEAYKTALSDLDYYHSIGLKSDEAYYHEAMALAQEYYDLNIIGLDELRKHEITLHRYRAQVLEDFQKETDATREKHLNRQYERESYYINKAYEDRAEALEKEIALEEERINVALAGIDEEIAARRRLREDQSQDTAIERAQKKLLAAEAEVLLARDEDSRINAEKEVARQQQALADLRQQKEDTLFYRQKEQEKELLQNELQSIREAGDEQLALLTQERDMRLEALQAAYDTATGNENQLHELKMEDLDKEHQAKMNALKAEYEQALWYQAALQKGDETQWRSEEEKTGRPSVTTSAGKSADKAIAAAAAAVSAVANTVSAASKAISNTQNLSVTQVNKTVTTAGLGAFAVGNIIMDMVRKK